MIINWQKKCSVSTMFTNHSTPIFFFWFFFIIIIIVLKSRIFARYLYQNELCSYTNLSWKNHSRWKGFSKFRKESTDLHISKGNKQNQMTLHLIAFQSVTFWVWYKKEHLEFTPFWINTKIVCLNQRTVRTRKKSRKTIFLLS